jgi:hypothetical protein
MLEAESGNKDRLPVNYFDTENWEKALADLCAIK